MDLLVGLGVLLWGGDQGRQNKDGMEVCMHPSAGRSGKREKGKTHGEILRGSIGIGNVPVDEGDAGFKGRLVLEINSGGIEDVEYDGTALWSCGELCGGTGNGRGRTKRRVCIVCEVVDARGGNSWGEGGGIEETGERGLSSAGMTDDE